jgi:hypothetical protein
MELKEAIDKLFEMTDEQRMEVFETKDVKEVLDDYFTGCITKRIEDFYSKPKYGDVYLDRNGDKVIILDGGLTLHEKYKCPQSMSFDYIYECFTKTGKNVADELKGLFE